MVAKTRDSQYELERKVKERTAQLEAAAGALLMVTQSGVITTANARAEELFGYDSNELLGSRWKYWCRTIPRRAPGFAKQFFCATHSTTDGVGRELFGQRRDGTEVPIEIGLNPIQTDEGAFVLASIIDITERKRADERFRLVVEAAPSAMIMVDDQGLISL